MAALAWLLIPLFACLGAAIWGGWASRDRTVGDTAELTGYERFRDVMERSAAEKAERAGRAAGADQDERADGPGRTGSAGKPVLEESRAGG
ncbi:hypothetical protein NX801_01615 [Streptomyces sp. LP05-1]|uniref:Secreted protein n=1 Tax=Streptomyces pyxinae TaxID=2970734 RepID=A0ABT2CAF6_9ACTN|nr:hypothetical protein [Streptomyces sp. LP05-1]MCS0634383.1 hypothetical protein [Streptomyces sp. LP05-1]